MNEPKHEAGGTDRFSRKRKLIHPGMQLRLSLWFACLAMVGLLLQFILFSGVMSEVALDLPGDAQQNFERFSAGLIRALWVTVGLIVPLTFALGILQTFRIAGPLHRMTLFLRDLRDGKAPADCRIRRGDQLQEFCDLLNEATAPLRSGAGDAEGEREAA